MCVISLTTSPQHPLGAKFLSRSCMVSLLISASSLLYTFYQPDFYATHDQYFPSDSEDRAGFWVGFAEHCGDSLTHMVLDAVTNKIIYRSALRPRTPKDPNIRELLMLKGRKIISLTKTPLKIKPQCQMWRSQLHQTLLLSISNQAKMMVQPQASLCQESNNLVGRNFLLPPGENGDRLRAKVTRKVVEDIEQADGERVQKIIFILGIGNGKLEEIISYNQLVDHLEAAANDANEISDDLFKLRALFGHQGTLKPTKPNWKGCKYNVLVDWVTAEKTYEPLSVLTADDPVTCALYAKENDLLHIDGWKRVRNIEKMIRL